MTATLKHRELEEIGTGVVQFTISCRHRETVTIVTATEPPMSYPQQVLTALAAHDRQAGCGCTRRLHAIYQDMGNRSRRGRKAR